MRASFQNCSGAGLPRVSTTCASPSNGCGVTWGSCARCNALGPGPTFPRSSTFSSGVDVVHACAGWLEGNACRPMAGDAQVRGQRPVEGAAPSRACVRGAKRGRAKA
eukprot:6214316-Pleurochrysis_carterae.AAC.3